MRISQTYSNTTIISIVFILLSLGWLWYWENYYYRTKNEALQTLIHLQEQVTKNHVWTARARSSTSLVLLKQQVQQIDQQLQQTAGRVVSAAQMINFMKQITQTFPGIQFNTLQNDDASKNKNSLTLPGLYRHYLTLTFSGNYQAIYNYLIYLEKLPWQLGWQSLTYQVSQYPEAKITLNFYFYSPEATFIHG